MFSIEEIENIMDDTAEAVEKQNEIDALLSGQGRFSDYLGIMGQNSTFFRGTLEKLTSEGLQNCPRAVLEARGWQFLTRVPRKKVEFYHYTLVLQGFPIILPEQCLKRATRVMGR